MQKLNHLNCELVSDVKSKAPKAKTPHQHYRIIVTPHRFPSFLSAFWKPRNQERESAHSYMPLWQSQKTYSYSKKGWRQRKNSLIGLAKCAVALSSRMRLSSLTQESSLLGGRTEMYHGTAHVLPKQRLLQALLPGRSPLFLMQAKGAYGLLAAGILP